MFGVAFKHTDKQKSHIQHLIHILHLHDSHIQNPVGLVCSSNSSQKNISRQSLQLPDTQAAQSTPYTNTKMNLFLLNMVISQVNKLNQTPHLLDIDFMH